MPRWSEPPDLGDPGDPRGYEMLIERYLEWMAVHRYSANTVEVGRRMLRQFAAWCTERGAERPAEISRSLLERFQRWLFYYRQDNGRPLAFKTQQHRLTRIKGFFQWLARERYLEYDPASSLQIPKEPPRLPTDTFSLEEVERILAVPEVSTPIGLRDRAILETFYSSGLRRAELVALDVYDLDLDRGWLTIRQGKGRRDRVVPIGERALAWVVRYLEDARPQLLLTPDDWTLFLNAQGTRFHVDGLGARVRKLIEQSGVRRRWGACHLFRHTMATLMLEAGADIRYIQEILGHTHLQTTQIYTRVTIQKLKEIHSATHPGALLTRTRNVSEPTLAELRAEQEEEGS